jgi:hypothetical protein
LLTRKEPVFLSNACGRYQPNLSIYFISDIKIKPVRVVVVATQVPEEANEDEINTVASLA